VVSERVDWGQWESWLWSVRELTVTLWSVRELAGVSERVGWGQ
jgi:hypothetical protein